MNEQQIIALYFERNEQAITETAAKYGRLCHRIAYNILNNHEDCEECVNDTYIGVWNAIPPARPDISAKGQKLFCLKITVRKIFRPQILTRTHGVIFGIKLTAARLSICAIMARRTIRYCSYCQ